MGVKPIHSLPFSGQVTWYDSAHLQSPEFQCHQQWNKWNCQCKKEDMVSIKGHSVVYISDYCDRRGDGDSTSTETPDFGMNQTHSCSSFSRYLSFSARPLWLPQKYLKSDKDLPHSNLFGDNIYFSANFPSPYIRSLVGPQGPNDPGIWTSLKRQNRDLLQALFNYFNRSFSISSESTRARHFDSERYFSLLLVYARYALPFQ